MSQGGNCSSQRLAAHADSQNTSCNQKKVSGIGSCEFTMIDPQFDNGSKHRLLSEPFYMIEHPTANAVAAAIDCIWQCQQGSQAKLFTSVKHLSSCHHLPVIFQSSFSHLSVIFHTQVVHSCCKFEPWATLKSKSLASQTQKDFSQCLLPVCNTLGLRFAWRS